MRVFQSATVKGPYETDEGQTVYTVEALWRDTNGTPQNWRRAYSQSDYPQMQADFAAWPDVNGAYPNPATYAALAQWSV